MRQRFQLNRRRKGNTIMEFAIVAPLLMSMLVASFSLGMGLNRMIQASQVCRNANVLTVRGVDLSQSINQTMLVRTAQGLGLNIAGTNNPNPSGKAVVYLTKVMKVGNNACATGIPNWDGQASSCTNYGKYVIASRIVIGNTAMGVSLTGSPSSTLASNGNVSDYNIAMVSGNRATNFSDTAGASTIITLSNDEYTYVSEVFADSSDLVIPYLFTTNVISVRNVS